MIKYTSDFKKGFTKMKVPRQGRSDAEPDSSPDKMCISKITRI